MKTKNNHLLLSVQLCAFLGGSSYCQAELCGIQGVVVSKEKGSAH